MTGEENLTELKKHRTLLFAMLDYYLEHYIGSMVFDQWDPAADYYLQQKQQTEKDFQGGRLDMLKQMLDKLIEGLCNQGDLDFMRHLKEKTGYDIDVSEELLNHASVGDALKKEEIVLPNSIVVQVNSEKLTEEEMSNLNRYLSYQPTEFNFRSSLRKVMVQTNGGNNATTGVSIVLRGGSGCIYCASGENLPIKAFWKDRSTVVIETKKEYAVIIRHDQVSSLQDVVKIEYIES